MTDIAIFRSARAQGQDGLFFSVEVTVPGGNDPVASPLSVAGWVAHERGQVTGVLLNTSLGETLGRSRPVAVRETQAGDSQPSLSSERSGPRPRPVAAFRLEVSRLEVSGADVAVSAEVTHADGRRNSIRLGTISGLAPVRLLLASPMDPSRTEKKVRLAPEGSPPGERQAIAQAADRGSLSRAVERVRAGLRDPVKVLDMMSRRRTGIALHLDSPSPDQRTSTIIPTRVSGWAFSRAAPIERVEVRVGERLLGIAAHGLRRPDVAVTHPREPSAESSGFGQWMVLSDLQPGSHELVITAIDAAGNQESIRQRIAVIAPAPDDTPEARTRSIVPGMPEGALLFMHIPKTAGTSIRHLLDSLVPQESRFYLYRDTPGMPEAVFQALPEEERARARLILGHFRFGVHEWLPQRARYVTMVRDPVERVISQYFHHRTYPKSDNHDRIVDESISIGDFIGDSKLFVDNQMVRQISGVRGIPNGRTEESMLTTALENIDGHFEAVLVMEEMERSMRRLGEVLGTSLPPLPRRNTNSVRPHSDTVDPAIRARIAAVDHLDVALYERLRSGPI